MIKIAVLDLYEGTPNQGMRCIHDLVHHYTSSEGVEIQYDVFDVRSRAEVPDMSYDIYISSGGPGSPLDSEGSEWEANYFELMDNIIHYNNTHQEDKKYVFLICHSFQLFCRYYRFGKVSLRRKMSYGIFPTHLTEAGEADRLLNKLSNPFWIADFRKYQVTEPDLARIKAFGGEILCFEKERPHVDLDRAVMAIRFSHEIYGTQFHPEADPVGMLVWFKNEEKKREIIETVGEEKYLDMLDHLDDTDKIHLTQNTVIPNFLDLSLKAKMLSFA